MTVSSSLLSTEGPAATAVALGASDAGVVGPAAGSAGAGGVDWPEALARTALDSEPPEGAARASGAEDASPAAGSAMDSRLMSPRLALSSSLRNREPSQRKM